MTTESDTDRVEFAWFVNKPRALVRLNPTRDELVDRLQQMIADYNAGSLNSEQFFAELIEFANALDEEENRSVREGLTEEELAIYDIITRPSPELTDVETKLVKLKESRLVLDWRKQRQTRAAVRVAVETELDHLPRKFDVDLFQAKCDLVYQHIYDHYWDDGRSTHQIAA